MNDKLLQKKGRVVAQIAAELLGKEVHDRFMPIMYYQDKFKASQGTVQNAINFLKEKGAVKLKNKGYQGSFIEAIDYDILREYCDKKKITGCMPLPHSGKLELLAFYLRSHLQGKDIQFEMNYLQNDQTQLDYVLQDTCDFMVCSKYAAEQYIEKYPELMIAKTFPIGSLLEHPIMVRTTKAHMETLSVLSDRAEWKQLGLHYAKQHDMATRMVTKKEFINDIRNKEAVAGILSLDDLYDHEHMYLSQIDEERYQDDMIGVLLMKQEHADVAEVLSHYLSSDDLKKADTEYAKGTLELQY